MKNSRVGKAWRLTTTLLQFVLVTFLAEPAVAQAEEPVVYTMATFADASSLRPLPPGQAQFNSIYRDPAHPGQFYASFGHAIISIPPNGAPFVLAGVVDVQGSANGKGPSARFYYPDEIVGDADGNLIVVDTANNSIRKVTPDGEVTTLAGLIRGDQDGTGLNARLQIPTAITRATNGLFYVVDGHTKIKSVSAGGEVKTVFDVSSFQVTFVPQSAIYSINLGGVAVGPNGDLFATVITNVGQHGMQVPTNHVTTIKVTGLNSYTVLNHLEPVYQMDWVQNEGRLQFSPTGQLVLLAGNELFADGVWLETDRKTVDYSFKTATDFEFGDSGEIYLSEGGARAKIRVFWPLGSPPGIISDLVGGELAFGGAIELKVTAVGSAPLSYEWYRDGVRILNAEGPSYLATELGNYELKVTNRAGSVWSTRASVRSANRLVNISARALAAGGEKDIVLGFVLRPSGSSTSKVLIRGAGPSLSAFSIANPLPATRLTLYNRTGAVMDTNQGWNNAVNAAQIAKAIDGSGAFPFALNSKDSAILTELPAGAYTATVSSPEAKLGVALAEVYEVDARDTQRDLINLSSRLFVGSGETVAIGGISVRGSKPTRVLLRAIGPTLQVLGVNQPLAKPRLELKSEGGTSLALNEGWTTSADPSALNAVATASGAFVLVNERADSAIVATLAPGNYTALVSGADGGSGIVLIEAYLAPE